MTLEARKLSKNLKAAMRSAALSPRLLGEKAGMAFKTVYRILAGENTPNRRTVRALAEALGTTPEELAK